VSDRSDELRRQRELLRQHLAWLDREISRADAEAPAPAAPSARQEPPRIIQPAFSVTASDADRDADAILAEYRMSAPAVENQTKRGCILYFAVAMALFIALSAAFIFFFEKSRH
jgi:hypothetical protein